ncbi:Mitochondrial distribution and morphology protein 10, partial [Frankliniella fusca]
MEGRSYFRIRECRPPAAADSQIFQNPGMVSCGDLKERERGGGSVHMCYGHRS